MVYLTEKSRGIIYSVRVLGLRGTALVVHNSVVIMAHCWTEHLFILCR